MPKGDAPKKYKTWEAGPKRTTNGLNEIAVGMTDHSERIFSLEQKGPQITDAIVISNGIPKTAVIPGIIGDTILQ